ncbi:Protein of unknown function DUF3337 [Trinorchestia longiramus]|nr:Protein of unknown function DUF3337 [Trinorchestia longiramus]
MLILPAAFTFCSFVCSANSISIAQFLNKKCEEDDGTDAKLDIRDRLSANDFIQVRKVQEHVAEKVLNYGTNSNSDNSSNNNASSNAPTPTPNASGEDKENSLLPEDRVQLLCNDKVLDGNMDLRTVQHFIWGSSSQDLVLHYRPLK